jgi:hypothetical protein
LNGNQLENITGERERRGPVNSQKNKTLKLKKNKISNFNHLNVHQIPVGQTGIDFSRVWAHGHKQTNKIVYNCVSNEIHTQKKCLPSKTKRDHPLTNHSSLSSGFPPSNVHSIRRTTKAKPNQQYLQQTPHPFMPFRDVITGDQAMPYNTAWTSFAFWL